MTQERTKDALVAGGLGVIGRNLVEHLAAGPDWRVTAISLRELLACFLRRNAGPLVRVGIISSFVFSFLLSFNEYPRAYFLVGQQNT